MNYYILGLLFIIAITIAYSIHQLRRDSRKGRDYFTKKSNDIDANDSDDSFRIALEKLVSNHDKLKINDKIEEQQNTYESIIEQYTSQNDIAAEHAFILLPEFASALELSIKESVELLITHGLIAKDDQKIIFTQKGLRYGGKFVKNVIAFNKNVFDEFNPKTEIFKYNKLHPVWIYLIILISIVVVLVSFIL